MSKALVTYFSVSGVTFAASGMGECVAALKVSAPNAEFVEGCIVKSDEEIAGLAALA